jgi:hypothetical protein
VAAFGFLAAKISAGSKSCSHTLNRAMTFFGPPMAQTTSTVLKNALPAFPHVTSPSPPEELARGSHVSGNRRVGHLSTSRRVRGAADIVRDALLRANDPDFSFDAKTELSPTANRLSKGERAVRSTRNASGLLYLEAHGTSSLGLRRLANQAKDVMFASLSQGTLVIEMVTDRSMLSVQQRIQAAVGRTKELARLCVFAMSAVGEAVSRFLDNLALQGQHALSVLEMSLDDRRRDLIIFAQEVNRISAVRKARELALLVASNVLFLTISFVQVGKNELHRSSERKIAAVLQVNSKAWQVVQDAASPRMEGMGDARRAVAGALSQAKNALFDRFRKNGDKLKGGASSMGRHLPFHKRHASTLE